MLVAKRGTDVHFQDVPCSPDPVGDAMRVAYDLAVCRVVRKQGDDEPLTWSSRFFVGQG